MVCKNKPNLLKFLVARPHLPTPAERDSLFLSEWECRHQVAASLTPHNGPSLTPVSSSRTLPSCHLPLESFPRHLDPKRQQSRTHNDVCLTQVILKGYQECFSYGTS